MGKPQIILFLTAIFLCSNIFAFSCRAESRRSMDLTEILASEESCEECHEKATPRIYAEHAAGVHAREGVGCVDCHGDDHRNMVTVTARNGCTQCHPEETAEYLASDHSKSWENMLASARYMKQPGVVRRQGCESCHRIGFGENDGRCDFCHTKHGFSKAEAARPASCYTCHMGPDHPQMEAYRKSGHHFTPATCASCHFPDTHNVNANLDRLSRDYIGMECSQCHDQAFNRQWMDGAVMLEEQGKQLLAAGQRIIEQLNDKGLLYPNPREREPNPVEGRTLVLGDHQLYEDTSRAEKLYFEMKKYLQVHLVQGAYHQDFKMAAYEGLIPLRNYLAELQSEAQLLEELTTEKEPLTPVDTYIRQRDTADLYQKIYESSFHGVLPDDRSKPDCRNCHGDHEPRPLSTEELSAICGECHTEAQVGVIRRDLAEIKNHATSLSHTGRSTIKELLDGGIVQKGKDNRLELKAVLSSDSSRAVALILVDRLNHYLVDLDESVKVMVAGAAHSNPDYAHWYGNAPAKSDLIEIRDAAHKLTQIKKIYGKRSSVLIWSILLITGFLLTVFYIGIIRRRARRG